MPAMCATRHGLDGKTAIVTGCAGGFGRTVVALMWACDGCV
jgi:NAD(P)-dependent dehydrogenase (short-subunit alcohol dehydrogenase family)